MQFAHETKSACEVRIIFSTLCTLLHFLDFHTHHFKRICCNLPIIPLIVIRSAETS